MVRPFRAIWLAFAIITAAAPAFAQRSVPSLPASDDWTHGTTISLTGGFGRASSDTGALIGAALGWELRPRLAVEGGGIWLDRRDGGEGFGAAIKVRSGLTRSGTSPFVEGGFGLYHLSTQAAASLPAFYQRRLGEGVRASGFTDPMFQIGGGVNVFASRRLALQPAVEAMIVTRGGHAYTIAAVSLRVAYHFEEHPVTPAR